jgi:hypothetical protein
MPNYTFEKFAAFFSTVFVCNLKNYLFSMTDFLATLGLMAVTYEYCS